MHFDLWPPRTLGESGVQQRVMWHLVLVGQPCSLAEAQAAFPRTRRSYRSDYYLHCFSALIRIPICCLSSPHNTSSTHSQYCPVMLYSYTLAHTHVRHHFPIPQFEDRLKVCQAFELRLLIYFWASVRWYLSSRLFKVSHVPSCSPLMGKNEDDNWPVSQGLAHTARLPQVRINPAHSLTITVSPPWI